ncbi:MAG: retropepsin-like aspartic protease, partial [Acidobacteriota bacterium]
MKRALVVALALSFSAAAPAVADRQTAANPMDRLARLYEDHRHFELRDALARIKNWPSIDREFFRGAVDQAFNRLDPAVLRLRNYLQATEDRPGRMLAKEAWALLADAFCRLGRYREGAEAWRRILDRFGDALDDDERAGCESQFALWSALSGVAPQSVDVEADTTIRMKNRQFPVSVGDRVFYVGYDTGASLSVLYESAANELGVRIYGPPVRIQTGTGAWIEGRIAVVPEMRLGAIVIRNAVFFVLQDKLFARASARSGADRRGLLGMPVLAAFKEFTETRQGELIIPSHPAPRPRQNMCISGFLPVVEALRRGTRLSFCLDTGSAAT